MIMKKYISLFVVALVISLGFASCNVETDEPAGGTAVEKMAGHWVVQVDVIDNGQVIEDPYGIGLWDMYTYNTAADESDKMWLSDGNNFWGYQVKVPINLNAQTFACEHVFMYNDGEEDQFLTITDGKVVPNGGVNVNGKPTDLIEYKIEFTDDPGTIYYIHGVRYAGF